jgi:UDP-N-acetylglucosamine 2-epimerase (non-hydrolysing)
LAAQVAFWRQIPVVHLQAARASEIEVVLLGELAAHGAVHSLSQHDRAIVVRDLPLAELVDLIAANTVLVSDEPELVIDAPGLGTRRC